jgi:hypothetical protein
MLAECVPCHSQPGINQGCRRISSHTTALRADSRWAFCVQSRPRTSIAKRGCFNARPASLRKRSKLDFEEEWATTKRSPISGNESALKTFSCHRRALAKPLSSAVRQSRADLLKPEVSFRMVRPTDHESGRPHKRHDSVRDCVVGFLDLAGISVFVRRINSYKLPAIRST